MRKYVHNINVNKIEDQIFFSYNNNNNQLINVNNLTLYTFHKYLFIINDNINFNIIENENILIKDNVNSIELEILTINDNYNLEYLYNGVLKGVIKIENIIKYDYDIALSKNIEEVMEIINDIIIIPIGNTMTLNVTEVDGADIDHSVGAAAWYENKIFLNKSNKFNTQEFTLNNVKYDFNTIIIIHETLHLFGIGIDWKIKNTDHNGDNIEDPWWYYDYQAVKRYQGLCLINNYDPSNLENCLPIEDNFGNGTQGFHLEEGTDESLSNIIRKKNNIYYPTFTKEITTGFIDNDNYITNITLGFLHDLNFVVNYESRFINNNIKLQTVEKNLTDIEVVNIYNKLKNENNDIVLHLKLPDKYNYILDNINQPKYRWQGTMLKPSNDPNNFNEYFEKPTISVAVCILRWIISGGNELNKPVKFSGDNRYYIIREEDLKFLDVKSNITGEMSNKISISDAVYILRWIVSGGKIDINNDDNNIGTNKESGLLFHGRKYYINKIAI